MVITQRPLTVEHQLEIDLSQLKSIPGDELVFFEAFRQGESTPTIQLTIVGEADPGLLVDLTSDDRSKSAETTLLPPGEHVLVIRWTAPIETGTGTIEVTVDGQEIIAAHNLTLEAMLPDVIRVGVLDCNPGLSGIFIFDPLSTTFEHF